MEDFTIKSAYLKLPSGQANPLSYSPRRCFCLGLGQAHEISYKLYVIHSDRFNFNDIPPLPQLHCVVKRGLEDWTAPADHPVAFAILHLANDGTYLLISRWNNANNIRHRVFAVELMDEQIQISPLEDQWIIACVWETRLISFEVNAWIEQVLMAQVDVLSPEVIRQYLSIQLTGTL